MTLWTSDDAKAATGGAVTGAPWAASGVSIDSRTVAPGDLFVALSGPNFDGHEFAADAFDRGAAAAMVASATATMGAQASAGRLRLSGSLLEIV